ncbi:hypothetical protein Cadr_000005343 [Camelus dromedarius]|uniref:Uncharacterized protein n=1 Tax=Camelus dromedarius TaxID=9838 RepID=A0A5N4E267_CAMDR|nr:hypothetical protein Cadr_000005343 [Camelus dromedarius]
MCSPQAPKVIKAHLAHQAHLGPQALQVPQGPLEAEDPKAFGNQTCSTASAQVTHPCPGDPPLQLMIPNSLASPPDIFLNRRRFCLERVFPLTHTPGRPKQSAWG